MTRIVQTERAEHREGGLTTFVPLRFKRHGAKKVVMHAQPTSEEGPALKPEADRPDPHVVEVIAQGLYWQGLLAEQKVRGAAEIARVEGVDRARVTKVTRLAQLAPDLIQAIVAGRLPISLQRLLRYELPYDWSEQRRLLVEG